MFLPVSPVSHASFDNETISSVQHVREYLPIFWSVPNVIWYPTIQSRSVRVDNQAVSGSWFKSNAGIILPQVWFVYAGLWNVRNGSRVYVVDHAQSRFSPRIRYLHLKMRGESCFQSACEQNMIWGQPCSIRGQGRLGKVMRVIPAFVYLIEATSSDESQDDGEHGNPNRSRGGSLGSFVCGACSLFAGWWSMWLAFRLADRPWGTHTWRSRLCYAACGCLAVIFIGQGLFLTFRFIVIRKRLHSYFFSYYDNCMANVLGIDKQIAIIGSLCEGSSIRSIERMTGVHRDTIMRLGVKAGKGSALLMDTKMRNLSCNRLELDEIWGFVGKKQKHVQPEEQKLGDVWTFCAIDAETKLVPSFKVGKRDNATANAFVQDIAGRMTNRVQISTDGLKAYVEAIEKSFGADVDYAQIIKTYGHEEASNNRRYSAPEFVSSEKRLIMGQPNIDLVSTSYIERLNATTRLHMRRLTRLTLAFSKKFENFEAAVGLHFAYYNLVKRHNTLRCTPAMAAGVERSFWTVGELVEAATV